MQYACRKTLADSRPRVRGRFAKNLDDDLPATFHGRKRDDEDDEEVCEVSVSFDFSDFGVIVLCKVVEGCSIMYGLGTLMLICIISDRCCLCMSVTCNYLVSTSNSFHA